MNAEIVQTFTDDGLRLDGLLFEPDTKNKKCIVLHFHGLAGNFYGNPFIGHLARSLTSRGFAFLTVNNRGHDCLSEFYKRSTVFSGDVLCGNMYELFDDCVLDVYAWTKFISQSNYDNVILEGHSSGANKVAYYQSVKQDDMVKGLILISPPDTLGLQDKEWGEQWQENVAIAEKMVRQNKGDNLMPDGVFHYPICAKSYLSFVGSNTKAGIFNFYDADDPFTVVGSIRNPILGVIGTENEAVVNDVYDCMSTLKAKAVSSPLCDTNVISNAPHSYAGYEKELTTIISNWLERLF